MPRSLFHVLLLLLTYSTSIRAGQRIQGIFSKKLIEPGYYLVTTIPKDAKSINVTEISHTKNFLAIRLQNGTYLFNEDYNINSSGKYKGAGTNFIYIRRNDYNPEMFYAAGPLYSSIDVMLIYHHDEPEVSYQYELPNDAEPMFTMPEKAVTKSLELEGSPSTNFVSTISENVMMRDETRSSTVMPMKRRKRKRSYVWRAVGFTTCSKSCGGGVQTKKYACVQERINKQVSDKRCKLKEKPEIVPIRCQSNPCPPQWKGGPWSQCSVTCGNGTRTRELQCINVMPDNLHRRANDDECPPKSRNEISLQEPCHMPDCDIYTTTASSLTTRQQMQQQHKPLTAAVAATPRWKVEEWSQCSASCGNGTRTRNVKCMYGKTCSVKEKPATEEVCNLGSCKSKSIIDNEIPEALTYDPWLYSAWPETCSAECGRGTVTRRLYCEKFSKNETCNEKKMPVLQKNCVSNHTCSQWFIGPWTKCSASCDFGYMTREVICVSKFLRVLKVVPPSNCPGEQPETVSGCMISRCEASWFMSDWTQCSKSCGGGIQKRAVRCILPDGAPASQDELECDKKSRPLSERDCNIQACGARSTGRKTNVTSKNNVQSENEVGHECRDILAEQCLSIRNRNPEAKYKCQVEIYKKGCCQACRYSSVARSSGKR